eukprot:SAG31_NODE_922_length_10976_cov_8.838742_12_plen_54_part_00
MLEAHHSNMCTVSCLSEKVPHQRHRRTLTYRKCCIKDMVEHLPTASKTASAAF